MDWIQLAEDVYGYHFVNMPINEDCCFLRCEATQNYITQNIISRMIMTLNCHRRKRSSWMSCFRLLEHLDRCYPLCQTCERFGLKQIWIRKKTGERVSRIKNEQCSMRSAHCTHYYYGLIQVKLTCRMNVETKNL